MTNSQKAQPPVFIDEQVNVYEGADAVTRLKAKSDSAVDPGRGIAQVDFARWQEAQRYERKSWMEIYTEARTDRNEYHRERFAGYSPIRGFHFSRGIELGCGPFTNMRLIIEHSTIVEVHLLDPLIEEYLIHPGCSYRKGRLTYRYSGPAVSVRHPLTFLKSKLKDLGRGREKRHPVVIHRSMIETLQIDQRFDLVVMVNVLEHCQNAFAVFDKIKELLLPGGILVFRELLFHADEVKRLSAILYDAGHPLRVDQSVIDGFLQDFKPLMRAEYYVSRNFRGLQLQDHELYYIGRRQGI